MYRDKRRASPLILTDVLFTLFWQAHLRPEGHVSVVLATYGPITQGSTLSPLPFPYHQCRYDV